MKNAAGVDIELCRIAEEILYAAEQRERREGHCLPLEWRKLYQRRSRKSRLRAAAARATAAADG